MLCVNWCSLVQVVAANRAVNHLEQSLMPSRNNFSDIIFFNIDGDLKKIQQIAMVRIKKYLDRKIKKSFGTSIGLNIHVLS